MKLTLADSKYLKDSISIISELVTESSFQISTESVELVAMDPANVAMVIFKMPKSTFLEYDVTEKTMLNINLNNLKQILNRAKPADVVTLEIEDSKLKIQLKSNSTKTFYLPIIDLAEREQRIPDLNFPITIKTESSIFNEAIEDVDIIGESVIFTAEKNKFTIASEGDLSKAKIEIPEDEVTGVMIESDEKITAKYSIEYLKKIIKGSKISPNVTIHFNKDYPIKIEYHQADKVHMSFILAPRVDND